MASSAPSSILQIEQHFQDLKFRLSGQIGARTRLDLYHDFLSPLIKLDNPPRFLSYYEELHADFLSLILDETLLFRSPAYLDDLNTCCTTMLNSGAGVADEPAFQEAFRILELRRIALNFYIGDISGALQGMDLELQDFDPDPESSHYGQFLQIYDHLSASGIPIPSVMEHIRHEWASLAGGLSDDRVWIPLVEKGLDREDPASPPATIQPLTVTVDLRSADSEGDLIFFNNHPMERGNLFYDQALGAVTLARKQLKANWSGHDPSFRVMFGFPHTDYFYTGESFGLGMSLVVLAQMEKVTIQRVQHKLMTNAVITGGIDSLGQVRGISDATLPAKLEAFQYSPFEIFVHPLVNQPMVQETLTRFDKQPQPDEIIAIEDMKSALRNERITRSHKIPLQIWARAHLRRSQLFQMLLTLLLLAIIVTGLGYFMRDLNPVTAQISDNRIIASNSRNRILWSHTMFPQELMGLYESHNNDLRGKIIVKDLDGDGQNEVVFSLVHQDPNLSGHLICLTPTGEPLWDADLTATEIFGDEAYPAPYLINILQAVTREDGKLQFVAILNNHPLFPSKLALISSAGKILGTYYHGGHITGLNFADISGDGQADLIFGGTNNETRDAVLGVLDMTEISGHSPQLNDNYRHTGSPEARHLRYLSFPKADWVDMGQRSRNFAIADIDKAGESELNITVHNKALRYYVIYHFGTDLSYQGATIADIMNEAYLNVHGHSLSEDHSFEQAQAALSKIQVWSGSGWLPYLGE